MSQVRSLFCLELKNYLSQQAETVSECMLQYALLIVANRVSLLALGSDQLPIMIKLPGHIAAPRRARSYVNFLRADWEGFEKETETLFSSLAPPPLSCAKGEKEFRKVLATAAKHHIPAGHRIPEAVGSLIEERDSCRVIALETLGSRS